MKMVDDHVKEFGDKKTELKQISNMKVTITKIKFFPNKLWFFWFRKYTRVKGFIIRIFGYEFNVREFDATNKLIKIANEKRNSEIT